MLRAARRFAFSFGMNTAAQKSCRKIEPLLAARVAGELAADEANPVDTHLSVCSACVSEEQGLADIWQKLNLLPEPEIPTVLYETTHEKILSQLKRGKMSFYWIENISELGGVWSAIFSILAGLVITGISYFLLHKTIGSGAHHYYVFLPLLGLWWLVFGVCFALLLKQLRGRVLHLGVVSARSMFVTLLTLIISFFAYETDFFRGPAMFAASKLAAGSLSLLAWETVSLRDGGSTVVLLLSLEH